MKLLYSTPHDTKEHGLYTANVLIGDVQLIFAHPPIKFSSVPSHALDDRSTDLCQLRHDAWDSQECVTLHEDGWIRGDDGQLFLWVPPAFRESFYSMWTKLIIPQGVELDLSEMVHGSKWNECYVP